MRFFVILVSDEDAVAFLRTSSPIKPKVVLAVEEEEVFISPSLLFNKP